MLTRPPEVSFGCFAFDPHSRVLKREGVEVPLPPRVIGVLELLLANPGDIVSRRELIETVWKDAFVTDTSLAEAISFLRQALGDDPQSPTYIQTVHRRGYRFLPALAEPARKTRPAEPRADEPTVRISYDIVAWSIAALSLVGAASAMWFATRQMPADPAVVQMVVEAGDGLRFDRSAPALALSRAGDAIAWSACDHVGCRLFARSTANVSARALETTSGAAAPFFSPDGRWIGFFADGKLKKVLLQGGPPIVIADAPHPGGATWMRDGRIVFAASIAGGLLRVNENGGSVEALTQPSIADGELRHVYPISTASGEAVTFIAVTSAVTGAPGRLMLVSAGGGTPRVLVDNVTSGALVGNEFVTYTRGQNLFAQPYHAGKQEVTGGEQVVASGVATPHLAMSPSGALAYAKADVFASDSGEPRWRWIGPELHPAAVLPFVDAVLSPTATRVAGIAADSSSEVWTADLTRGTTARVTHSVPAASPVWSADGNAVFYASKRSGRYEIWARDSSATGAEHQVLANVARHLVPASAARQRLVFVETGGADGANIGIIDVQNGTSPLLVNTRFDETEPALSPDGEWLVYQTDESGQWEIVLLDLATGRRLPVSTNGGTRPAWRADGKALFFESRGAVMRVTITASGEPEGAATLVHALQSERLAGVAGGGSLFLEHEATPRATRAVVTLEWIRELRRVVGPPPVPLPR